MIDSDNYSAAVDIFSVARRYLNAAEAHWNYNCVWFCMVIAIRYVAADSRAACYSTGQDRWCSTVIQLNCRLYC